MTTPESNADTTVPEMLNGVPPSHRDPTFNAPWEAHAFAITVAMHRRGVFEWHEWAEALGAQIKRAQANGDPDDGTTYYLHWLAAIEALVQEKGLTDRDTLLHYQSAWQRAADRTPHGQPIELLPQDLE